MLEKRKRTAIPQAKTMAQRLPGSAWFTFAGIIPDGLERAFHFRIGSLIR
jgi:hypothetical protein